jgi:carboxypeptidase C (cathepsin A)
MLDMRQRTKLRILICVVAFAVVTPHLTAAEQQHPKQQQQQQPIWEATHGPITQLPGYSGELRSKHYGGYISVGSKQLYYYMVESERSPATDPVV